MPSNESIPYSREAEQSVLGAMMQSGDAVALASEHLIAEDFYFPQHKVIYQAMITLYETGKPIDLVTALDALYARGAVDGVGGTDYVADLLLNVPAVSNASQYIRIVEEKSVLRRLIDASQKIDGAAREAQEGPAPVIELAEKEIFDIALSRSKDSFIHIKPTLVQVFGQIERAAKDKRRVTGTSTGFSLLDWKTSGLQNSDLILLAARPSMGKSAFALNIASNVALNGGLPVGIFALEMSREQVVNRMLCAHALVSLSKARTGDLEDEDWGKLIGSMNMLAKAQIYIDDTPGITVGEVRSKCRRLKLEHGLGLIVIDYIQLMSASAGKRQDSRQQEISDISRALKILAREMNCPVLALSQLSRAVEQRPNHRPILSDLRESGAIEQDADIVMFLYRDSYYNQDVESDEPDNVAELNIAKQRNGETGTMKMLWLSEYTLFRDMPREEYGA